MRTRIAPLAVVIVSLAACASTTPGLSPGQRFPVFFTNAAVVPDARGDAVIAAAAGWARRYPAEKIRVIGYADPRATQSEITHLATHRADEVAALLEAKGVSPDRIARRIGDEALIGASGLPNRRVDIAVGM